MTNINDIYNKLEGMIVQVLQKKGVLNNYHEIGIVIRQMSEHSVLVAPTQFDKEAEEIPCADIEGGYREGDRVLIEYLNGSAHHKYVICVMQKGYEKEAIDYTALKDTPARVFRRLGSITQDPSDMIVDLGDEKPIPLVYKILYDEGSPMEWWEILHRDTKGWLVAVETHWPPNGKIQFTNYIVKDDNNLFHYYGPNRYTSIWSTSS